MRYEDVVLADGPVAYYPLTEKSGSTANDISGNARHLTWTGTPTIAGDGVAGGRAAALDGATSATVASAAWMDLASYTLECWVRTLVTASALQGVFGRRSSGDWYEIYVRTDGSYAGVPTLIGRGYEAAAGIRVNDGRLHHVAAQGTHPNGAMRIYVDGRFAGSFTAGPNTTASTGGLFIGQEGGGSRFLTGQVGHCALYDKILPANRIAAHYRSGIRPVQRTAFGWRRA